MSAFRASPFHRASNLPTQHSTLSREPSATPTRIPSSARRLHTPSFLRRPRDSSPTRDPSRFGFAAFREKHLRYDRTADLSSSFRTPERLPAHRPRDPSRNDHFDEDRISKTPAKDRNDEWLASLGFDLELLKLSARRDSVRDEETEENRHPNIVAATPPRPPSYTPKRTPLRMSMSAGGPRAAAGGSRPPLGTRTGIPAFDLGESAPSPAPVLHAPTESSAPAEAITFSMGDEGAVNTEHVETSAHLRSTQQVFAEESSVSVSYGEDSSAHHSTQPCDEVAVATPSVQRRHTTLASDSHAAADESIFCTPRATPPSCMRESMIGRPTATSRRHTDWRLEANSTTESTVNEAALTPARVKSARKSRRASARVSVRELRALAEGQESMGFKAEKATSVSKRKTRSRRSMAAVDGDGRKTDQADGNLATANFVLSPVRATKQQREVLGSESIVTPVRRSLRISMRHVPVVKIDDVGEHNAERLESADYAFLPNQSLPEKVAVERKPIR